MKKVCIMGLGYIGLPTAAMFASSGCDVIGVDVDINKVEMINKKKVPIKEPGLDELIRRVVHNGKLKASTQPEKADAFLITVPTPVTKDKNADLSYVRSACEAIGDYVEPGNIIVLESTVPPLTVEGLVIPILQSYGIDTGKIYIGHCPERVIPGNILTEIINNDRIVGGVNVESTVAIAELYRIFVKGQILETDCTTAEMVKLMENTYRDVNIALANEFALISDRLGINVWEAISLANKHPRVNLHLPGPGVGGHCIAIDPYFIIESAPEISELTKTARKINRNMPEYVVKLVEANVTPGQKVAVLGLSYKANVDDTRESPSLEIVELLKAKGYKVIAHDPYVEKSASFKECLNKAVCMIITVDHSAFGALDPENCARYLANRMVIDTKNSIDHSMWVEAGYKVVLLGDGGLEPLEVRKEAKLA